MTGDQLDLRSLMALATESSVESRSTLATDIRNLVAGRSTGMSVREGAMVLGLWEKLLQDIEGRLRSELADRLTRIPGTNASLLSLLRDQRADLSIAALTAGGLGNDTELAEAIRHRAMQHQLAQSMRRSLEARVAIVLGDPAEPDITQTLLESGDTTLATAAREYLLEEAERTDDYGEPRLRLEELEPALVSRLYWRVAAALRQGLIDRFDLDPAQLDDTIEAVVPAIAPVLEPGGFAPDSGTRRLVEHLALTGGISSDLLVRSLRQGSVALSELLFGRLINLAMLRLRRILLDPSARSFAIACRAIDLDRQSFATLYLLRYQGGDRSVQDPGELSRVLRLYDSIRPEDARQVLRQWRRHPTYVEAIETIGTG